MDKATRILRAQRAPFPVGRKELYLPDFSITFHRTDSLSARHARFSVPLWFSKLDLRDYLWHAYDVKILGVRTYVKQSRVIGHDPEASRPTPNRWHRPRATKMMTVELEEPFLWPEPVEDLAAWNKAEMEAEQKTTREMQKQMSPTGDTYVNEERRDRMREQAKALLEGKERWRPSRPGGSVGGVVNRW